MFVLMQKKWFYNTLIISILEPKDEKWEGDLMAERKNKISLTFLTNNLRNNAKVSWQDYAWQVVDRENHQCSRITKNGLWHNFGFWLFPLISYQCFIRQTGGYFLELRFCVILRKKMRKYVTTLAKAKEEQRKGESGDREVQESPWGSCLVETVYVYR